MPSYRRHVARHPLALARAKRYVRRHATETQAYLIGTPPLPRRTRRLFAAWENTLPVPLGVSCTVCEHAPHGGDQGCPFTYSPGGALRCGCTGEAPKIAPAECETCSHPHRREITCTYVNGFWQCRCTA